MSDPSFSVNEPSSSANTISGNDLGSGSNLICLAGGDVDAGDCHNLIAIFVHNTTAQLTGTDAQKAQAIRDAAQEVSDINSASFTWKKDAQISAIPGQTNYFHAVADFDGTSSPGCEDPVTILAANIAWTPNELGPTTDCPPRSAKEDEGESETSEKPLSRSARRSLAESSAGGTREKSTAGCKGCVSSRSKAVLRVVDVRPVEELSDNGLWLRYVLFNKNGFDGNRLMLTDGVTPLQANTIAIAATAVYWRPSIRRNQILARPDGLSDTSHSEPGTASGSQIAMRFPGSRKWSLGVVQNLGLGAGFHHQVIHSQSRSNPDLVNLTLTSDVLIQHNSNIFNIYGHTLQGLIEICVKIEA